MYSVTVTIEANLIPNSIHFDKVYLYLDLPVYLPAVSLAPDLGGNTHTRKPHYSEQ